MSGIDDMKRSLAEWCAIAAERTTEAAKVTSRRYDRFALGREIERRYAELGALVHAGLSEGRQDVLTDPRVAALRAEVEELMRERRLKDQEIEDIKRQSGRWREPGDGKDSGPGDAGGGATTRDRAERGDRHPDFSD